MDWTQVYGNFRRENDDKPPDLGVPFFRQSSNGYIYIYIYQVIEVDMGQHKTNPLKLVGDSNPNMDSYLYKPSFSHPNIIEIIFKTDIKIAQLETMASKSCYDDQEWLFAVATSACFFQHAGFLWRDFLPLRGCHRVGNVPLWDFHHPNGHWIHWI